MKQNLKLCILVGLLLGCSSAEKQHTKQQQELEQRSSEIETLEEGVENKGKAYVYGTGLALSKTTNSEPATEVAKELNKKAEVILGPPSVDDAIEMHKIVNGLTSDLAKEREHARKLELTFATTVAEQQAQIAELKNEYERRLKEAEARNAENASKAAEWDAYQRKTWLKRLLWTLGPLGIIGLIIAVMVIFPVTVPFVARFVTWIVAKLPKAAGAVGTVSVKAFDQLVAGVGSIRTQLKMEKQLPKEAQRTYTAADVQYMVDNALARNIDADHKALIDARRLAVAADSIS